MEVEERDFLIRVAGYGRVSTDSKDQKNSLEHQVSCYERDYKNNPKYIYDERFLYFDRGISGTKLSRPQFDQMLYDAGLDIIEVRNKDNDPRKKYLDYITMPSSTRKPKFDLIIVRNTSRFARNVNAVRILEQLKGLKVYVYFCDIDKTTRKDTDMEEIESHILNAERESRIKSRIVSFGIKESALEGVIRASKNLYGYKYIGNENYLEIRLEIIEEEAKIIRQIYKWYLEGYGIRAIKRLLTKNGMFTRQGKEFAVNTIRGILTNEKYKGWSVRNKYDTGVVFNKNSYAKVRDKKEWIIHKNTDKIPAIVSEEEFDKAQELLYSKVSHQLNKGRYFGTSEFASKIVCGKCGKVYHANRDGDRKFYNCSNKRRNGLDKCDNKNVSLKQINKRISPENYRSDIYKANLCYLQELQILEYRLTQNISLKDEEKVNQLKEELQQLEERKDRVLNMYEMGHINLEEFELKIKPISEQIREKNVEIIQLSRNNEEIMEDIAKIKETTSILFSEFKVLLNQSDETFSKEHPRETIVKDVKKIRVNEDGSMDVLYHTFDRYYKLIEKHKYLVDIYLKDDTDIAKWKDELVGKVKYELKELLKKASA